MYVNNLFKMINKPIEFTIKGKQESWYQTSGTIASSGSDTRADASISGTIIGYIVQTTATDPGVSLSWYDSGSTPNVVLGIITSADEPLPKIHRVVYVEKLKID